MPVRAVVLDENCILPECHVCGKECSIFCFSQDEIERMKKEVVKSLRDRGWLKDAQESKDEYIYPCAVCTNCVKFEEV